MLEDYELNIGISGPIGSACEGVYSGLTKTGRPCYSDDIGRGAFMGLLSLPPGVIEESGLDPRNGSAEDFRERIMASIDQNCLLPVARILSEVAVKVNILIDSPGGYFSRDLTRFINWLKSMGSQITTMALDEAQSAAGNVFLTGNERIVFPDTHLMWHLPTNLYAPNLAGSGTEVSKLTGTIEDRAIATRSMVDGILSVAPVSKKDVLGQEIATQLAADTPDGRIIMKGVRANDFGIATRLGASRGEVRFDETDLHAFGINSVMADVRRMF
ncbi:MAG: ATP-dependent Clp protease proteolytic subunit [Candidatus Gracilibacteria bacterium]